jgi:hypothetical protein
MGVSGQRHAPAALLPPGKGPPGKGPPVPGGWVGPRAGLDTEARGKILCPCRGSNPDRPVVQTVVRHCTDWANPALPCMSRWLLYLAPDDDPLMAETYSAVFMILCITSVGVKWRNCSVTDQMMDYLTGSAPLCVPVDVLGNVQSWAWLIN